MRSAAGRRAIGERGGERVHRWCINRARAVCSNAIDCHRGGLSCPALIGSARVVNDHGSACKASLPRRQEHDCVSTTEIWQGERDQLRRTPGQRELSASALSSDILARAERPTTGGGGGGVPSISDLDVQRVISKATGAWRAEPTVFSNNHGAAVGNALIGARCNRAAHSNREHIGRSHSTAVVNVRRSVRNSSEREKFCQTCNMANTLLIGVQRFLGR